MNEGSLYDCICKNMQTEYIAYKNILQAKLAGLSTDDLDLEENAIPAVEKIFLEEVPCSFRYIMNVYKRYEVGEDNELHFRGFIARANKKVMDNLEFDSFITALSKNFQRMTRGALKHQAEYKAFSNNINEAAVSHWILPSEDCWKKATLPEKWKDYLRGKADGRILNRLLWYIGAIQDANNKAEQALIISDNGDTGKSTLLSVLQKLFPENFFGYITNGTLDDKKDFALSERKTYEHHCLILDEYDGKSINSPVFKNLIGTKVPISMPVKNKQAIEHNFTGTKMIVVSNEKSLLETHAYRRRVIPISFKQNHNHTNVFSDKDNEELVKEGKEFLNFCFKVYKTCKLTKPNGEYIVLSPEEEKKYLEGKEIDIKPDIISVKAISNDEAISEFFIVHDYDNSEISLETQSFINEHFEKTENADDMISCRDIYNYIANVASNAEDFKLGEYKSLFGTSLVEHRTNSGTREFYINYNSGDWRRFVAIMKSIGFGQKTDSNSNTRVWTKIRFKKTADNSIEKKKEEKQADDFNELFDDNKK